MLQEYNGLLYGLIRTQYDTTAAFAETVGVSRNIVSQVLNGRWELTEKQMRKWAAALGTDIDYLWPLDES